MRLMSLIKFLRINVKKRTEGWCQLAFQPLLDTVDGNYYRLSFKARNQSRVSAAFCVRPLNAIQDYVFIEHGNFSGSWEKYSFAYHTKANKQPIGFFVIIYGAGTFDISGLQLIEQSESEYLAYIKSNYKDSGEKNLLRNSRFPLGLQSGWSLDRDNSDTDDVIISGDPAIIGPSGSPAMRITAKEDMKLNTAPFAVNKAFEIHTASMYIRGNWDGKLIVLGDRDQLASKDFHSKTVEWQRVKVSFSPRLIARAYGLRLEGKGDIWIDALQVESGSDATLYNSQFPCEVALSCPEGEASPALAQFDDESPMVRFCVTGNVPDAILKVKVVNLYGEEKSIQNVSIGDGFINYGMIKYNVFPEKPYGAFRIEAYVKKPNGERISPYNEIIIHRLHRPRYWMKDAPDSPFGIHTNSTVRHILMAKAVGVNWTRLHDAGGIYLILMTTAYQTTKSVDDKITVLGVNTTTATGNADRFSGEEWTRGIVDNGGLDYCDVVCYHNYTPEPMGFPGDDAEIGFKIATGPIVERFGKNTKSIWMTEGSNIFLKTGAGFYNYTLPYKSLENVIDTSDYLCRHIISLLGLGVEKVFLYSMHTHNYFPDTSLINGRVLVTEEGMLHPSADAYSAMAWYLEDTKFVKLLTLADDVYAYLFSGQNHSIAVLSSKYSHAEFKIPQNNDIRAFDLFGNPITPDTLLGDTLVYLVTNKGIELLGIAS